MMAKAKPMAANITPDQKSFGLRNRMVAPLCCHIIDGLFLLATVQIC
jgi:hypothetical protein